MITKRHQMDRRGFLRVSSTCAIVTAVAGPNLMASALSSTPVRLAIGFASPDTAGVVGADTIPAADGAFIGRGARITVSGASGAPVDSRARRTVDLLAHYSYFEGAERHSVPFRAWSCSRSTGCQGNQVSFNVPVDEVQKLAFSIETERGTPSGAPASRRELFGGTTERTVEPVVLSLTSETGSIKLVRGYYVLVPLFAGDPAPSWSSFEVRHHGGRLALVDGNGEVAPFEHFILKVDYAPSR